MMKPGRHPLICILVILGVTTLTGCASTKNLGYGTVIQEKKIAAKDYKPGQATLIGTSVGAGAGAVTGAYIGAASGAATGVILSVGTFGIGAVYIPVFTALGAASGAAIGGLAGGATGAGIGYATDIHHKGVGVYEFTIKPDNNQKTIVATQYVQSPIPVDTKVEIVLKDDQYYIVPTGK